MPRGLDHIVHAVRDLDAAAALYRRLGFQVGARNRHPWGTHNHLVQFPGCFIELVTVAEPDKLVGEGLPTLFGRFNQAFLARQEGLSLLMLGTDDAAADAAAFAATRIAASSVVTFERTGQRPDGSPMTVGFSLAFARDPKAPGIGFASCQHHHLENIWSPALQRHSNAASGIAGVVMVAENPSDHHIFLSAFVGERELLATSTGITLATRQGDIQVMAPDAFRSHFATAAPDVSGGARLAGLRLAVADPSVVRTMLGVAGVPHREVMDRIVVGPGAAMGATLIFEQSR